MPGEYSDVDLMSMSPEEIAAAAQRGWKKNEMRDPADALTSPDAPQPSGDVWKRRKSGQDIFTCPSGQTCRVRRLLPEQLLMTGILDKVTRLEGLAAALVAEAEGAPPEKQRMPSREELADLLQTVNAVVPLAVVEPEVLPDPPEGEKADPEKLYASDIELSDRMAIMEYSLRGVKKMDRFHNP